MTIAQSELRSGSQMLERVRILLVAALCAVSAELLAAYAANTGHIGEILFAIVFFMGLYGAPALLMRELVRRSGWGWPSMIFLFAALGIAQACLIDQSLFAEQYGGYQGWEDTRQLTLIPLLGISAENAYNFILGHVIFSFGAPIAIAEAWRPSRAAEPWLGLIGLIVAPLAYVGIALLIVLDPQSHSASNTQLLISLLLIVSCVGLAWFLGRKRRLAKTPSSTKVQFSPIVVLAATFILATAGTVAGDGWLGLAGGLSSVAVILGLIWWISGQGIWSPRYAAAVGLGFLASRGMLAFTYFPLAGSVDAIPKYTHNAVMMAVVLLAGYFAFRRPASSADPARAPGQVE